MLLVSETSEGKGWKIQMNENEQRKIFDKKVNLDFKQNWKYNSIKNTHFRIILHKLS